MPVTVLHKVMSDGSVVHEPLTRDTWNSALSDPSVKRRWGHPEEDCHDVVARELGRIRREFVLVQTTEEPASGEEPVSWPPDRELSPWMLCQLTTLCLDDARDILRCWRPLAESPKGPVANPDGQFALFF